jgi:hypothetical protein
VVGSSSRPLSLCVGVAGRSSSSGSLGLAAAQRGGKEWRRGTMSGTAGPREGKQRAQEQEEEEEEEDEEEEATPRTVTKPLPKTPRKEQEEEAMHW